jgi:hypothetical protein
MTTRPNSDLPGGDPRDEPEPDGEPFTSRVLAAATQAPAAAECCSPDERDSCCAAAERSACCGATSRGSCGCR